MRKKKNGNLWTVKEFRNNPLKEVQKLQEHTNREQNEISKTIYEQNEKFHKEYITHTHKKTEILELTNKRTKLIELNNSTVNPNSRFNHVEERISDLENRTIQVIESEEENKKRLQKSEESNKVTQTPKLDNHYKKGNYRSISLRNSDAKLNKMQANRI